MFNKKENAMGQLIRVCILGWSAALLTASYAGTLSKMDPTFIATVSQLLLPLLVLTQ
jgi:hypothetical protein